MINSHKISFAQTICIAVLNFELRSEHSAAINLLIFEMLSLIYTYINQGEDPEK